MNTQPATYIKLDDGTEVIARRVDENTFVVTTTVGQETRQQEYSEHAFFVTYKPLPAEVLTHDYPDALRALKLGKRIYRLNWNGNNQWVVLIRAGNAMHTSAAGSFDMQDCFGLKNAQNKMQPGWIPSIGDQLAEDWIIKD